MHTIFLKLVSRRLQYLGINRWKSQSLNFKFWWQVKNLSLFFFSCKIFYILINYIIIYIILQNCAKIYSQDNNWPTDIFSLKILSWNRHNCRVQSMHWFSNSFFQLFVRFARDCQSFKIYICFFSIGFEQYRI